MEKIVKPIDDTTQEVIFTFTKEELHPIYEAAYKQQQPKIALQGFRKGKVPLPMIKKFYGESIEADAEQEHFNKVFFDYVKEGKVTVIGTPAMTDVKKENDTLAVTIQYEVLPTFDVVGYKDMQINEPVHVVTDEEVESEIHIIKTRMGRLEKAEIASDFDHVVKIEISEIDKETNTPKEEKQENVILLSDEKVDQQLKDALLNTKAGENITFIPTEESNPNNAHFNIAILEVQKHFPAELTEELISQITGGRLTNEEDLREDITFQLQGEWDKKARNLMENQIVDNLVAANPVKAPSDMVERVMQQQFRSLLSRNGINEKQAKNLKMDMFRTQLEPGAVQVVRWELIRERIIEQEKIEVEDFDYENLAAEEARLNNTDKDTILAELKGNENVKFYLLSKKVMDLILDFATTNEVDFSFFDNKPDTMTEMYGGEDEHDHDHDHHDHDGHDHHHHDHDGHDHKH